MLEMSFFFLKQMSELSCAPGGDNSAVSCAGDLSHCNLCALQRPGAGLTTTGVILLTLVSEHKYSRLLLNILHAKFSHGHVKRVVVVCLSSILSATQGENCNHKPRGCP